jgi:hypothetical protein
MSSVTNREMLGRVERRLQQISLEETALQKLQRTIGADASRQDQELEGAFDHLAEVLVPGLDAPRLDVASRALHLPNIGAAVAAQMRHTILLRATQRRAELVVDPRVQSAEAIDNEVAIRFAELQEAAAPLETSTRALEVEPLFLELLAHRYGTPEYVVRFWQLSYYKHWKHADLIVEAHAARSQRDTFAGIAARYVEERTALDELRREMSVQQGRRTEVKELQQELAACERTIADVDSTVLATLRTRVKDHLKPLDDAALTSLMATDPAAGLAVKRILGVKKKKTYLGALESEQIKTSLRDLGAMKGKLVRTRTKLGRPKNRAATYTAAVAERMVGADRSDRWHKRRQRLDEARTRIVEFHHYDRWSPMSDLLWWDVMTDGRLDGDFIPEVRDRGPRLHQQQVVQHRDEWRSDRDVDIS